jgi:hypothetical protein
MTQIAFIGLASLICFSTLSVSAQSDGTNTITQSVIANGGGKSADATYAIEGTFAQPAAGSVSTNSPYMFQAGFWQAFLAPTAASVSMNGLLVTTTGRPVPNSRVILTNARGDFTRTTLTNTFGFYWFEGIESGQSYVVDVVTRGLRFEQRVVTVLDEITDFDLIVFE